MSCGLIDFSKMGIDKKVNKKQITDCLKILVDVVDKDIKKYGTKEANKEKRQKELTMFIERFSDREKLAK